MGIVQKELTKALVSHLIYFVEKQVWFENKFAHQWQSCVHITAIVSHLSLKHIFKFQSKPKQTINDSTYCDIFPGHGGDWCGSKYSLIVPWKNPLLTSLQVVRLIWRCWWTYLPPGHGVIAVRDSCEVRPLRSPLGTLPVPSVQFM